MNRDTQWATILLVASQVQGLERATVWSTSEHPETPKAAPPASLDECDQGTPKKLSIQASHNCTESISTLTLSVSSTPVLIGPLFGRL